MKSPAALAAVALALLPCIAFAQALEGRLKKIKDSGSITLAHRTNAPPFSFTDEQNRPAGYTVDLCKKVVAQIQQSIGAGNLEVKWLPVTIEDRFDVLARNQADMLCGATTVTLARMKRMDFSSYIFVDTTGLLARAELKAKALGDLSGKKIGVLGGSTNEGALRAELKERGVSADVVVVKSRAEALAKLEAGEVHAFASDTLLLLGMQGLAKDPKSLALLAEALSFEPYAIALPRDAAFRSEVNTALARIFRRQEVMDIYKVWFGKLGEPGSVLRFTFSIGAIPE